jgi:exonuclease III
MRYLNVLIGVSALLVILVFGMTGDSDQRSPVVQFEPTASLSGKTFTVVELNARWLFDGIDDEQFYDAPHSEEAAEAHLSDVASYLATTNADFICIEEIESADMLRRLNEKLGGTYHEIFVQGTDDGTGQDVAALSRVPVLDMGRTNETQSYPIPGSRIRAPRGTIDVAKNFWATIELGDQAVTFIGVHFLAYPNELDRYVQREAQALIIQKLAGSFLSQGSDLVILGDINDYDSVTCDAAGDQPRSCVDELLRDIDPDIAGDELVSATASLPQTDRYTYWYDENKNGIDDGDLEHSMIDHVYVSRDLAAQISGVRIDHEAYAADTVSDHWPIVVTFQIP